MSFMFFVFFVFLCFYVWFCLDLALMGSLSLLGARPFSISSTVPVRVSLASYLFDTSSELAMYNMVFLDYLVFFALFIHPHAAEMRFCFWSPTSHALLFSHVHSIVWFSCQSIFLQGVCLSVRRVLYVHDLNLPLFVLVQQPRPSRRRHCRLTIHHTDHNTEVRTFCRVFRRTDVQQCPDTGAVLRS